jgi:hypothetical protein
MTRKVAIIGASPSRKQGPWFDPAWECWALNEIAQPRYEKHFELHPRSVQSPKDFAWLAQCQRPCYVLDPDEWRPGEIPMPVRYPFDWVLEVTGGRRYFTATFCFQIALALAEGYEEIGLWGVDLDLGTARERLVEKPCVEYWLGFAQGRGVKVTLPPTSTLLSRRYVYGVDYHAEKADIEQVCREFGAADWHTWSDETWHAFAKKLEAAGR